MKLFRFVNDSGETIYELRANFRCELRTPEQPPESAENQNPESIPEGQDNSQESEKPNDGKVRTHWRLISAIMATPQTGLPWTQYVDYSFEGGKNLRGFINIINKKNPDVTWNHSDNAHDIAGYLENAYWEDSTDIPPGINATLVVDPQFDPRAAYGLENGYIRSGSIGIDMALDKSHKDMSWEKFVQQQGKKVKGEVVRWIPKTPKDVRHMGMISHGAGADPNAGKRTELTASADNLASMNNTQPEKIESKGENWTMKTAYALLMSIVASLGFRDVQISEQEELPADLGDKITARIDALSAIKAKYADFKAQLENLGKSMVKEGDAPLEASDVMERLPEELSYAKYGRAYLGHLQNQAVEMFDKAKVDPKQDMTDVQKRQRERLRNSPDIQHLEDCIAEYKAEIEAKFGPLSNQSSGQTELPQEGKGEALDPQKRMIAQSVASVFGSKKGNEKEGK